ncbi:MAG: hypothetical protein MUQ32_16480, partial [Chloroflexi bacterium]|nr:hypothetical protein [Chloroflexota bacterium]
MTEPRAQRAWPGALDWGGDWLADTRSGLEHLGFELRDGSLPGSVPGPRLLLAIRDEPTLDHFDPELVTFWEARGGHGHLASIDRAARVPETRPWSWGPIRVTDRVPVSNQFLGFGGTLLLDACGGTCTYLAFTSRAPIVRWAGHSQGVDPLVDEIGAFFARLMVPVDYQDGAEGRIAEADPEALYGVFVQHSLARVHHSHQLRDADPGLARWLEHEGHRLANDAPAPPLSSAAISLKRIAPASHRQFNIRNSASVGSLLAFLGMKPCLFYFNRTRKFYF